MDIGQKIKQARLAKGLTQEELGKLVGVQKSAVAKYENGRIVNIKRSTLQKISDVLNIRPAELIWEETQKNNSTIADAVVRMRVDDEFLSVVSCLLLLDSEKIASVKQLVSAFQK